MNCEPCISTLTGTVINGLKAVKTFCEIYPDYRLEYQKLHIKIYGSLKYFKH